MKNGDGKSQVQFTKTREAATEKLTVEKKS